MFDRTPATEYERAMSALRREDARTRLLMASCPDLLVPAIFRPIGNQYVGHR